MAITRQEKEDIVRDLNEKLTKSKSAVFVNYAGINVAGLEKMRNELRKDGADFKVAKKTLMDIVFKNHHIDVAVKSLQGEIALVLGYKDEVAPAKVISKLAKQIENVKILAGLLGREVIGKDKVEELARLPSYEELLAKMAGSMQAPVSGFVNVLAGNIRGLVQVLSAISQK